MALFHGWSSENSSAPGLRGHRHDIAAGAAARLHTCPGGTSADVSRFTIIADIARNAKISIISKSAVPDVALIDPEPTTTSLLLTAAPERYDKIGEQWACIPAARARSMEKDVRQPAKNSLNDECMITNRPGEA